MLRCDLSGQILGRVESASIGPPGSEIPTIPPPLTLQELFAVARCFLQSKVSFSPAHGWSY